jgi:hypothetical protein
LLFLGLMTFKVSCTSEGSFGPQVNIETLPNREERELFKDFMEDYNTATLPSKKYYNLELHHRNKVAKMHARGQQLVQAEKVVFDDEAEKRCGVLVLNGASVEEMG